MDDTTARELLAAERERIEQSIAILDAGETQAEGEQGEPGERDSEDLYEKERDTGRAEELSAQLAAVARAEQRLSDGTYGLSVRSGEPIPDDRLQALPTAELTVEEQRSQGS
jgi:DnaK suppressor protein